MANNITINDLKNKNCIDAAPNGVRGTFRKNPLKGNRWQSVDVMYYQGRNNKAASYSDAEILACICE